MTPRKKSDSEDPRQRSEAAEFKEEITGAVRRSVPRRPPTDSVVDLLFSPKLSESWNDFIRSQEVRGLADSSLEQMGRISRQLIDVAGDKMLLELTSTDVDEYIVAMRRRGNQPSTINTNIQWLRAWLNWCTGKGRSCDGPRYPIGFDVDDIRNVKAPKKEKRIADQEAVGRLIESLDDTTFDGLRFKTTVLLLLDTGIRAGEACSMDVGDVSADFSSIRVFGKGSRERTVYLSREMSDQLRIWMRYRSRAMEYAGMSDNVVLFPSLTGNRQISVQIGDLFRSRCKLAGISPTVTAHGLRHLWATNHVRSGTNAFLLKQLGGWSGMQIVTTYISEVGGDEASMANQNASLVKNIVGRRVPRRPK